MARINYTIKYYPPEAMLYTASGRRSSRCPLKVVETIEAKLKRAKIAYNKQIKLNNYELEWFWQNGSMIAVPVRFDHIKITA